jgi:hypothetical protein
MSRSFEVANEILSYLEMCQRERCSLQRGMNFGLGGNHSVILMSVRRNAPYRDQLDNDGSTLTYEGHDKPKDKECPDPKSVDQPEVTPSSKLTQNGIFHQVAQAYKRRDRPAERVRVYEKIREGIWSYNGIFHLVDSWKESDGVRMVFKFKLIAVAGEEDLSLPPVANPERRRVIPTRIKLAVWKRDGAKCTVCGATDELHFDHVLPFSKGGSSITAENVQLLCARHNLQKHDDIV